MTGREHDDEFEAYLKSRRLVHKSLSTLERPEPSEELDRLIIGQARQAIQSPTPVRVFQGPGWALPVGLAAAIVVAFTVLLDLGVHKARPQGVPTVTLDASEPSQPTRDEPVAAPEVTIPVAPLPEKRSALPSAATHAHARAVAPAAGSAAASGPVAATDRPVRTQSTAVVDARNEDIPAQPADSTKTPPPLAEPRAKQSVAPPPPDAGTWLKQIERLRAEGQTAEAEREFKRFRDVYPGYGLPAGSPPADGPPK